MTTILSDEDALNRIAWMLQNPEWNSAADYLEEIAEIIHRTDRETETIYRRDESGELFHEDCLPVQLPGTPFPPEGYGAVEEPGRALDLAHRCTRCYNYLLSRRGVRMSPVEEAAL